MSFKDNPDQLCPVCTEIDLTKALDPSHFPDLPAHDKYEWQPHIRVILTFTLERVAESGQFCALCSLLRKVATRVSDPRASIPRSYGHPARGLGGQPPPDGEGYTLAAVPSGSVFKDPVVDADEQRSARPSSVMLLVIRGSNILAVLAYEARNHGRTNIAGAVVDRAVAHAKEYGTVICATTEEPLEDDSPMRLRLVRPGRIDYDAVKIWISRCVEKHSACLNEGGYVPGMKVIDCATRKIVKPQPDTRYAALSYVWGKGAPEKYVYPSLPVDLPLVIEDAITVCKKLGIPYIWVDRYCIWQEDPVHKIGQINRMDEIYGKALITITAAAGNGSNHPLPGVGLPRHHGLQVQETVGERTFVADYGYGFQRRRLEMSKWFTRGWTFQELALSPRVLFFTDYGVSLQCLSAECLEHLSRPISLQDGMRSSTTQKDLHKARGIKTLLFSYSKRELSFDSDALNAVSGILKAWSRNDLRYSHIMGLPVVLPQASKRDADSLFLSLWDALTWYIGLGHLHAGVRRDGFPTWSWLSIRGQLEVGNSDMMQPSLTGIVQKSIIDGTAKIEMQDGVVHDWTDYAVSEAFAFPARNVLAIHLEGWCFAVGPFTRMQVDTRNLFCLEIESAGGFLRFHPDLGKNTTEADLQRPLEAICPYGLEEPRSALVFERTPEGARRVGMLQLVVWWFDGKGELYPKERCGLTMHFDDLEMKTVRLV